MIKSVAKPFGFSLLEMIGVLAVMGIMAGALALSVFQLIEEGYQTAEQQSLAAIRQSLVDSVRREQAIPNLTPAVWSVAVADYASLPPQRVLDNQKNFTRRFYADPMFFTSSNQAFTGYVQTQGLATMPFSPRMMVISSLTGNITTNLNTNARFTDVWEQAPTAVIVETDSLMIERINFAPLFMRVVLNNANTGQAGYVLEGGGEAAVAAASGGLDGSRTVFVLAGSRLGLNAAPFPGGAMQRQLLVTAENSLRYQLDGSVWNWVD